MTSRSKKSEDFQNEPIEDKLVSEVPGIGKTLGVKLASADIDKAYKVLAQFLMCDKKDAKFKDWLQKTCKANEEQQRDCFDAMKDWCSQHGL
ncbi:barrier-to-autointegration factor [Plakobranchus ocellatus]|uniref:Barrier-to-autointegration factor 1 n=1 Tax=Plakobranchus ocellatus TaxID=259542 RepID=A0AAV4CN55_9GAST|nr:barrier-to-autointegration factor [Plakobranchus ocellatus]